MSHVLTRRMTVEEFLARPEGDAKVELVDGRVEQHMPPRWDHGMDQLTLGASLRGHLRRADPRGVVTVEAELPTGPHSVRRADVMYFGPDSLDYLDRATGRITGPPDLVIEIVSPGATGRDYVDKLDEYARTGIPHYWIVDRERHTVETYELEGDAYRLVARFGRGEALTSPLLPGFSLPLAELFVE